MRPTGPLRVAILTHSTNPRGGVVHALALGEALVRLGHEAVVHAPDVEGGGFFRTALCDTASVAAEPAGPSVREMVETRIADYIRHFEIAGRRRFDVFHAHDGISGNALATLVERGLIQDFARTVHHVDSFDDARIAELQIRSIAAARHHFVVSDLWRSVLARDFGIAATIVGNGVDRRIFSPRADGREHSLRDRFGLGAGPVYLAIGGVEERKNTLRIFRAFQQVRAVHPSARLIIAGGASLLDHGAYQSAFKAEMAADLQSARAVVLAGPIDQVDMPALYRVADALAFPSVKEGFGLAAIEAIACGTPVVTSRIAPFIEHFDDDDVVWCDPHSEGSIANAMSAVLSPAIGKRCAAHAMRKLPHHDWDNVAAAHLPAYESLREKIDA
jgi:glycosyltransferase-like protein